jgi:cytochrome c
MKKHNLEFNKIAASVLFAAIIAMVVSLVTNALYKTQEDIKVAGYADKEPVASSVEPEEELNIALLMASADSADGSKVFKKCASCHTVNKGGANKVGPNLYGIVGSKQAAKAGYKYSGALSGLGGEWNRKELFAFMKSPKQYAKGTKMAFAGLKKPQDIANLVAYLESTK